MKPSHTLLPVARRLLRLLVIALALTCPSLAPAAPEPTAAPEKGRTDAPAPDATRPPTIPLRDGKYDYATLSEQMKKIKDKFPNETAVILSADADVVYDVLIQTMDACREASVRTADGKSERKPLFFDVSLSLVG